jgi:hypothetical protein
MGINKFFGFLYIIMTEGRKKYQKKIKKCHVLSPKKTIDQSNSPGK